MFQKSHRAELYSHVRQCSIRRSGILQQSHRTELYSQVMQCSNDRKVKQLLKFRARCRFGSFIIQLKIQFQFICVGFSPSIL